MSQARVFRVGGSNGAISGSIVSKMAADGHLGMTATARNPCVSWAFLFCFASHVFSNYGYTINFSFMDAVIQTVGPILALELIRCSSGKSSRFKVVNMIVTIYLMCTSW